MYNVYFYPKMDYKKAESPNPYILHFEKAIGLHHKIINKRNNKKGVLDFFQYFFSTDIFVFNWIEDLPFNRYGKVQLVFFVFFLYWAKIFRKKTIWVLHNKYSHNLEKNRWTDYMFSLMMKNASMIITHSSEGREFGKVKYPEHYKKIKYIIHPMGPVFKGDQIADKKYDLLMWGAIFPYKGILPFLEYMNETSNGSSLKIVILGKVFDSLYREQIHTQLTDNIILEEKFYELEEIATYARQSKFVLFTHQTFSFLSSGALMDSLRMGTIIVGPNYGAFRDLKDLGFVKTYHAYEDIIELCKNYQHLEKFEPDTLDEFYKENSWEAFAEKINSEIIQLFRKKGKSPKNKLLI